MTINFRNRLIFGACILLVLLIVVAIAGCSKSPATTSTTPPSAAASNPAGSPGATTTSPFQRQGVTGTLTAISGTTLTVSSVQGGEERVTLNSNTQIEKIASGTLADLKQGDTVVVTGASDASGNLAASLIVVQPQGQGGGFFASAPSGGLRSGTIGTLDSINSNTLTVKDIQGSQVMVNVSSATTIEQTVSGTTSDLHPGVNLTIQGSRDASGNMVATLVIVRPNAQQATTTPAPSTPATSTPPATTPASSPTPGTTPVISTDIPGITPTTPPAVGGTPIILILTPSNVSTVPAGDVTVSTLVSNFNLVNASGQANVDGEGHIIYYMDVYPPTIQGQSALTAQGTYAESTDTSYTWHDVGAGYHFFSAELVNNDNTPLLPAVTVTVYVTAQGNVQSTPTASVTPTPTNSP